MPKQHGFVRSEENVILTKIILMTDGTNGYAKGDTWCQRVFGTYGVGPLLPELLV